MRRSRMKNASRKARSISAESPLDGGGIGNSPVCGHGLSRPERAGFLRGVVADREDEMHLAERRAARIRPSSCCAGRRLECELPFNCFSASGRTVPEG